MSRTNINKKETKIKFVDIAVFILKKQLRKKKINVDKFYFFDNISENESLKKLLKTKTKNLEEFKKELIEFKEDLNEFANKLNKARRNWNSTFLRAIDRRSYEEEMNFEKEFESKIFPEFLDYYLFLKVKCSCNYTYTTATREFFGHEVKGAKVRTLNKEVEQMIEVIDTIINLKKADIEQKEIQKAEKALKKMILEQEQKNEED